MAITRADLNPHGVPLTPVQEINQERLVYVANELERRSGVPVRVSSPLRTAEEHKAIYKKLGRNPPKRSNHLFRNLDGSEGTASAVDLVDRDDRLKKYILANHSADKSILVELDIYIEDPSCTDTWLHVQTTAPASGNRIFIPFARASKK